jgi:hypothetical protein
MGMKSKPVFNSAFENEWNRYDISVVFMKLVEYHEEEEYTGLCSIIVERENKWRFRQDFGVLYSGSSSVILLTLSIFSIFKNSISFFITIIQYDKICIVKTEPYDHVAS